MQSASRFTGGWYENNESALTLDARCQEARKQNFKYHLPLNRRYGSSEHCLCQNGINNFYMVVLENVTSAAASSLILANVFERIYVNGLVSQRLKLATPLSTYRNKD
jgi:hypothetical protein